MLFTGTLGIEASSGVVMFWAASCCTTNDWIKIPAPAATRPAMTKAIPTTMTAFGKSCNLFILFSSFDDYAVIIGSSASVTLVLFVTLMLNKCHIHLKVI